MLGPPVCKSCELIGDYYPNEVAPDQQGDWLCPKCGHECEMYLFNYLYGYQNMILLATSIYKENQSHSVS